MYSATEIASCICSRYQTEYGKKIDEMKLHKLLYFVQRESFIQTGRSLFSEQFEAWKFGPVMPCIREYYKTNTFPDCSTDDVTDKIIDNVFKIYGDTRPWSLGMMSHEEISWKNARVGVPEDKNGNTKISAEDIRLDAERIKQMRNIV